MTLLMTKASVQRLLPQYKSLKVLRNQSSLGSGAKYHLLWSAADFISVKNDSWFLHLLKGLTSIIHNHSSLVSLRFSPIHINKVIIDFRTIFVFDAVSMRFFQMHFSQMICPRQDFEIQTSEIMLCIHPWSCEAITSLGRTCYPREKARGIAIPGTFQI